MSLACLLFLVAASAVASAAAPAAPPVPAPAPVSPISPAREKRLFTGSDNAVWIVRFEEGGPAFDLAMRKANGQWQWVQRGLSGRPAMAVASGGRLSVVFTSPFGQLDFDELTGNSTMAADPNDSRWPDAAIPLSMAETGDPATPRERGILAVVPRLAGAPATAPAAAPPGGGYELTTLPATRLASAAPAPAGTSRPAGESVASRIARSAAGRLATAPGERVTLGLFRRVGANWVHLADLDGVELKRGDRVLVAAAGACVYLAISRAPGGANRLEEWDGQAWLPVPLAGPSAVAPVLAMLTVNGRLVQVLAWPASAALPGKAAAATAPGGASRPAPSPTTAKGGGPPPKSPSPAGPGRGLFIAAFDPIGRTFSTVPVTRGEKPAAWAPDRLPQVTRLGAQLAMLWRDPNDALRFGTCPPNTGVLTALAPRVDEFERSAAEDKGDGLITLMWMVMLAVFVPMMLLRPRGEMRPFVLPDGVRLGGLGRRLLAAMIDLLPIYFLVSVAYRLSPWGMTDEQVRQMWRRLVEDQKIQVPLSLAVASVAVLMIYVIYGTITEYRVGATLGKRLLKLRVVGIGAEPPDLRQCLLRNLLKIIELMALQSPLFFLVMLIPIMTRYRQRLGDLIARTTVVDATSVRPPIPPPLPPASPPHADGRDDNNPFA